jgi:hypothetical protein
MAKNTPDDEFEQIGEECLAAAAKVDCSPGVYRAGLRGISDQIQVAIDASAEMDDDEGDDEK